MNQKITQVTKIAVFRNKKVRKTIHNNEWLVTVGCNKKILS